MSAGFAATVRAYRRRMGLSQEDLAEAAGMSVRSIRKIEAGRTATPRPATVRLLADAFRLTGAERDRFCWAAAEPSIVDFPGVAVPRQLPADVAGFTGRGAYLRQLDAALPSGGDRTTAVVISAIGGSAGIGKTALAVHWAHRSAGRFPDGQLYANLRGFDPAGSPVDPAVVMRGFLDALGVPPQQIPTSVEAQYGLYRSLLAGRRMLILLDNAREAEQVRPLLPGSPGCVVVVTSRSPLSGLVATEAARSVVLGALTTSEAHRLLATRLGKERVAAEPQAVQKIIAGCAGLPLGLVIVAARAAAHPEFPLAALVEQLDFGHRRLDAFAGDDPATDLRAVFSWSYRTLSPDSARLFRLLGLHPGPDLSPAAAASLAGLPLPGTIRLLTELVRTSLVTEQTPGRYACHDLLRAYAAELVSTDPERKRRAAVRRMLDHFLHTGHQAATVLLPQRVALPLDPPQPGVAVTELDSSPQALDWFIAEYRGLVAAVELAAGHGFDTHTWQLAHAVGTFALIRTLWRDLVVLGRLAVPAAERAGDLTGQIHAHRLLGLAYHRTGQFEDARNQLNRSMDIVRQTGDLANQASTHMNLSSLCADQDDIEGALQHVSDALALFRATGHRPGQAAALNNLGWLHSQRGELRQAITCCQQSLTIEREIDSWYGVARTLHSLGYAYRRLGQYREATACLGEALDKAQAVGDHLEEALVIAAIGDTHHAAGELAAAREAWQAAAGLLRQLQHPDAQKVQAKADGDADAPDAE